jgi:peptide/nickel transport system permease protein
MRLLRAVLPFVPPFLLFALLAGLMLFGLQQPVRWAEHKFILGYLTGTHHEVIPPFGPMTRVDVFEQGSNNLQPGHLYVLGSDAGGRDMLVLIAHGAVLSLELVVLVVVLRLLLGILVGVAMGLGSRPVRTLTVILSRWVAGFPYLVLAIVLITALSVWSPFGAFVIAMAMVGWRDIAQLTSERVESVLSQPYAEAATALGSGRLRTFRRHVIPHLRPVLVTETAFQASAVLVLLGELGFLQVYLGGRAIPFITDTSPPGNGPLTASYRLLASPELGQMLADARNYILKEQWLPVMMPALTLALLALAFEILGLALRYRDGSRQA